MEFMISATTDIGLTKNTNQDSFSVRQFRSNYGNVVLAVLCDGMGGLAKGEVASATLIRAFEKWSDHQLPQLLRNGLEEQALQRDWNQIITENNEKIKNYGKQTGINLGTTVTALLITGTRYHILNVGDTRAYEIADHIQVLTQDQTVVAQEIACGRLTPEEAERDPRRSVLLFPINSIRLFEIIISFGITYPAALISCWTNRINYCSVRCFNGKIHIRTIFTTIFTTSST